MGPNMYLSINKNDVASVSREKATGAKRPVVRMETPKVSSAPATPAISTGGAGAKVAGSSAGVAAVANPNESMTDESFKVGVVSVVKATRTRVYSVDGKNFAHVRKKLGAPGSGRKIAKTDWNATWSGTPGGGGRKWQSVVLTATITVTLPSWNSPAPGNTADAEQWLNYVRDLNEHEVGHAEIIHDGLVAFGQAASNLNEASEADLRAATDALLKSVQDRTTKRRQGYDRRGRRPASAPKKPT
jgi:predicted secreted Zn-dependent protease